jgi:AraC family transcriptional regulator of adaptative response / DNA-3-methyladenine glycosylase II
MLADEDLCYAALRSRDARFDGRFFTGVKTTGIYCRPICPARTPLRKNVRFFACAAAAEEAGFRPCRRCRPELAPGSPAWLGVSTTVARALTLIEAGALDEDDVETLSDRLGVGSRYLRRLFATHVGTSPHAIAVSRRAHLARMLLDATRRPIAEIALASGFQSVRRFNDVMRRIFDRTPTELRRRGRAVDEAAALLRLSFRPPLAWRAMLSFLAARAIPGVEEVDVDRGAYRRSFAGADGAGVLAARLARDGRAIELGVRGARAARWIDVVRRVRRIFDLDADPLAIATCLGASPTLARSVRRTPGLRVPGAWDPFETLVRAMLGQQISVAAATTIAGRLARRFGEPVGAAGEGGLTHVFPAARALAAADLTTIGLPRARARSLSETASAVARDPELLQAAPSLEALIDRLRALPGVGPWTAHYVAMRAFHEPDAFPTGDLVLRRAAGEVTARRLDELAEAWRPWRAYAAMHLWTMTVSSMERGHEDRALAS